MSIIIRTSSCTHALRDTVFLTKRVSSVWGKDDSGVEDVVCGIVGGVGAEILLLWVLISELSSVTMALFSASGVLSLSICIRIHTERMSVGSGGICDCQFNCSFVAQL